MEERRLVGAYAEAVRRYVRIARVTLDGPTYCSGCEVLMKEGSDAVKLNAGGVLDWWCPECAAGAAEV